MAFLRLMVLILIPLTVIYLSVLAYLCQRHREQLLASYQSGGTERERDAFVTAGVRVYAARIRGWLALAVFGIPLAGLAAQVFLTNTM